MSSKNFTKLSDEFRNQKIFKLILKYSIPTAVGTLMFTIYNVVDRIFISRVLGNEAIAGVGITFQIFMLFIAVGVMFGVGGATLASLQMGKHNFRAAERILGTLFWIFIWGGILTCAVGLIFLEPIIRLFGGTDVTMPYAKQYFGILLFFMPFDFLSMGTNNIIRSEGNPGFSMWNIAVGCVTNIILDYIFIFPLNMGVAGAAWATGISKMLSSGLVFWHFRYSSRRTLTLRWKNVKFNRKIFLRMCHIGISPFLMQSVFALVAIVLNHSLLNYAGDVGITVMTINTTIFMLMSIPNHGIIMGYQPITGYNYGAELYARTAECLKIAIWSGVVVTSFLLIVVELIAPWAFGTFCNFDPELTNRWVYSLRILMLGMPCWAFFGIASNFYQATGRPKKTIILNVFRQVVCMPGLLLLLPLFFGINGIWIAMPLADIIAASLVLFMIVPEYKRLKLLGNIDRAIRPIT
ncbi:MAG: MATE family efflux transporter [Victivallaceae bacterium]|nr:MATE family efflux transporter [Victivallaceae bacterium]